MNINHTPHADGNRDRNNRRNKGGTMRNNTWNRGRNKGRFGGGTVPPGVPPSNSLLTRTYKRNGTTERLSAHTPHTPMGTRGPEGLARGVELCARNGVFRCSALLIMFSVTMGPTRQIISDTAAEPVAPNERVSFRCPVF